MKIIHMMLSSFYIDNRLYQENLLSRQHKSDGHDVLIVASTETFDDTNNLTYVSPSKYMNEFNIPVIRLPYKNILGPYLSRKVRAYVGVFDILHSFSPDIIFFHGCCAWELLTIQKYKINNSKVKVFVDTHTDYNNSGRTLISKWILHKLLYKYTLNRVLPAIDKLFFITKETKKYLLEVYKIPPQKTEFLPLGGIILDDDVATKIRIKQRRILEKKNNDIVLLHSGKMNSQKRTLELLNAFSKINDERIKLLIAGTFSEDIADEAFGFINTDNRIEYLGWQNTDEIVNLLYAADLYLQPGSQSVTMQQALCCGCPVALFPYDSHKDLLGDTPFYIETENDIYELLVCILKNQTILKDKSQEALSFAKENLDYKTLAKKVIE